MPTLENQLSAANCFERAILLLSLLPRGPELTGASLPESPDTELDTQAAINQVHRGDAAAENAILQSRIQKLRAVTCGKASSGVLVRYLCKAQG
jgi:hypothetical protein